MAIDLRGFLSRDLFPAGGAAPVGGIGVAIGKVVARMAEYVLRVAPDAFAAVASGARTVALLREDDRPFAPGDVLVLREFQPSQFAAALGAIWQRMPQAPEDIQAGMQAAHDAAFTGRTCRVVVTHVLRDSEERWLQPGVVALSIRWWPDADEDGDLSSEELVARVRTVRRAMNREWYPDRVGSPSAPTSNAGASDLEALRQAVEQVLTEAWADAEALTDAINWGDLHCVDIQRTDRGWVVSIEEASPEAAAFQWYVQRRLAALGWRDVEVRTAW